MLHMADLLVLGRDAAQLQVGTPEWTRALRGLWRRVRHARDEGRAEQRAEAIRTVIIKRCEMLGADQSRMIRNILERGRARVVLDKVVARKEGGGLEVIDEPEQIKQRVRQHFQEWNTHRYLGTPTDRWDKVYAPREDIDAVWYDGVVIAVEEEELDEALRVSATGKAGGPSGIVNEMLRRLGPLGRDTLQAQVLQANNNSVLRGT